MAYVAGLDGCKNGWFGVFWEEITRDCAAARFDSIHEVLESSYKPSVVAIDIPIGLLNAAKRGGRDCDRAARALLGRPRASSVFSPPIRQALRYTHDYRAALNANRRSSAENVGIPRQCHALFTKISEAETLRATNIGYRMYEVHPELCFYEMNKCQPMHHGKKAKQGAGRSERTEVLRLTQFAGFLDDILADRVPGVAMDDALDALAACWTALRIASSKAIYVGDSSAKIWR